VLAFVVLLAASIVGFFSTATSARRESAGYEPGIAVRQLADVVTNVVLGQIADGTRSWEIPPVSASLKGRSAAHILDAAGAHPHEHGCGRDRTDLQAVFIRHNAHAAGQRMEREQQAHE
jgi:hypothetical protein